jgi:Asp-tRNA(Asn)/Glu-tRNA(Gln) amidotransferase A subunit family amidase
MDEYESHDALGLAALVKSGETSATALLDAAIERMEKWNPTLGAIVIPMLEEARADVAAGPPEGPFQGVPYLLKDLHMNQAGVRTTFGSKLFERFVPTRETELVARYRRAGLVTFGKTHSPEFGLTTSSESRLFGATRNPWNTEHSAGGSSGGASAAVAAGIVPMANASDGGGSIRIPASCCGLFGLKPTRGRTPLGPESGEGWSGMSCVHVVSRSVRDSAAALDATAGPDVGAPYAAQPPARPWLEEVGAPAGRLRIALQTASFNGTPTDPDCVAAAEDAARLCEELGHDVVPAQFDHDREALGQATMIIIATNTRFAMEQRAAELGRPLVEDDVEPGTWMMSLLATERSAMDYVGAIKTIHRVGRELAAFLAGFDVLLTPTMGAPPQQIGVLSLSNPDQQQRLPKLLQSVGFTQLLNATGNPSASIPLFWNAAGLPVGTQLTGRMDDEATLFRLSAQLEEARPWFDRRPPLGS